MKFFKSHSEPGHNNPHTFFMHDNTTWDLCLAGQKMISDAGMLVMFAGSSKLPNDIVLIDADGTKKEMTPKQVASLALAMFKHLHNM